MDFIRMNSSQSKAHWNWELCAQILWSKSPPHDRIMQLQTMMHNGFRMFRISFCMFRTIIIIINNLFHLLAISCCQSARVQFGMQWKSFHFVAFASFFSLYYLTRMNRSFQRFHRNEKKMVQKVKNIFWLLLNGNTISRSSAKIY